MQSISRDELIQELKSSPRLLVLVEGIDGCKTLAQELCPQYKRRYVPWAVPDQLREEYRQTHRLHREQQIQYLRGRYEEGRLESTVLQRSVWSSYLPELLRVHNPRALDAYRTTVASLQKDAQGAVQQLADLLQETKAAVVILGRRVSDRYGGKQATSLYLEFARDCKDLFYVEYPDANDSQAHEYDAQASRGNGVRLAQFASEQEAKCPVDDQESPVADLRGDPARGVADVR